MTNLNDRTLQKFSTQSQSKMYACSINCPYVDYNKFYTYYGDFNYADSWVLAALDGTPTPTTWTNGAADFSAVNDAATRREATKKGTAYMNVWMYAIREFEDAIGDCQAGCTGNTACNEATAGPVHAWDEGVAFYTGSTEGAYGGSSGKLVYALAEKRCANFRTCGANGNSVSGVSKVNLDLGAQFSLGQHYLHVGSCNRAIAPKDRIVDLMTVPLIQGTLRYAYKVEYLHDSTTSASTVLKEKAEGAVFAASVLPMISSCSPSAAATIYNNMRIGAASADFEAVKTAFESTYPCLGISCADVGGLVDGSGAYYSTSAPCSDAAGAAYGLIAGYNPGSKVTDHNAIDLDQDAMETQLADSAGPSWTNAKAVYTQGGFSKSYARFTLTSPITATEDTVVTGVANNGDAVSGTVKSSVTASTTLDVVYDTSTVQSTYVNCQVGGLTGSAINSRGCFTAARAIVVGGNTVLATGISSVVNLNDRTLQKF